MDLGDTNIQFIIPPHFITPPFIFYSFPYNTQGFPESSVGKESVCNAGDPRLIPGSGRSPGEGKGYPLQYSGVENSMDSPWGSKELDTTE